MFPNPAIKYFILTRLMPAKVHKYLKQKTGIIPILSIPLKIHEVNLFMLFLQLYYLKIILSMC